MVKKQPAKKSKKVAGKKAVAKAGVAKKTTPAKRAKSTGAKKTEKKLSKQEINRRLLEEELRYYNDNLSESLSRRTPANAKHKRGIRLEDLNERDTPVGKRFVSKDGSVYLTEQEYNKIMVNPKATVHFTPIKDNGKIIGYKNSRTGVIVSPHFRHNIYGKEFRKTETEEEVKRARVYEASLIQSRKERSIRRSGLIDSYLLRNEHIVDDLFNGDKAAARRYVAKDQNFIKLVEELELYSTGMHEALIEYRIYAEDYLTLSPIELENRLAALKKAAGSNPRYKEVLVDLGRRRPGFDGAVGESDPNHIKLEVVPFYNSLYSNVEFKEG